MLVIIGDHLCQLLFSLNKILDFHYNEIPKVCSNYTCLAVISLDSVLKKDQDYYLQVFLKKCKCINKRKKVIRHITDHLENSSGESDEY